MKRSFIFKDGNSQKFWDIDIDQCSFTVTYGKLGTAGQTSNKTYDTEEKCQKESTKLVAEKIKKGYVEVSEEDVKSAKNEGKKYFFNGYNEEGEAKDLAKKILTDKRLPELKYITIGYWGECFDNSPDAILEMMIENKEKFQHIESLFFGDMNYEECEISWILQSDQYGNLLKALPNLKILKIQGSEGLSLGENLDHASLEELQIICGGLPVNILTELKNAKLPNLKKLILYMGVEDYGGNCTVEDLAALAHKDLFPNLKVLGFVNSEQQDDIVEMLLDSDILPQLEVLDVSCGCLTDKGGQLILNAKDKLMGLKKLEANYHYMSKDMMKKLKDIPVDVSVSDKQEYDDDDDYMYPMITE